MQARRILGLVAVVSIAVPVAACQGGAKGGGTVRRDVAPAIPPLPPPAWPAARAADAAPPIALTASDGTGLELVRLDARAAVDGPLAFTELRLTFANPEDRVLEGRFTITMPERAAISRFAMKIDGRWMEAEVVERQAARRAYEDFLHRRQDPALLEKEAGNEFSARVFPIPARGEKELIVSYSQELADPNQPYALPLVGLPRVREVRARIGVARVDGGRLAWDELALDERDWTPDRDLAAPASAATHALGAPGVVAMRVAPELAAAPEPVTAATVLVDTSASRAAGFAAYARAVDELIAALGDAPVTVAGFDQEVVELWRGRAADARGAVEAALRARMALGASDLGAALAWARAHPAARVVVITDGVATAGEVEAAALAEVAGGPGVQRLDVVLAGGIRDRAAAEALTRGRLPRDGAVLDLDRGPAEVARRLGLATRSGIEVAVAGAAAVWPARLDGVQPGDAAIVYAWFDGERAPATVEVALGGDRRRLAVDPAAAPLVTRAAAQARIAALEAELGAAADPAARAAKAAEIVAVSTRERVLSSLTALLVLETEDDYRRFGIDRTALARILVVGDAGVELQGRDDVVLLAGDGDGDGRKGRDKNGGKLEKKKAAEAAGMLGGDLGGAADDGEAWNELGDATATPDEPGPGGFAGEPGAEMALEEGRMGRAEPPADSRPAPEREAPRRVARAPAVRQGEAEVRGDELRERRAATIAAEPPLPPPPPPAPEKPAGPPPLTGRLATVMDHLAAGRVAAARDEALAWRAEAPGDVLALVAVGEAAEAEGRRDLAARAYGSLIDLFPSRADVRRFAGQRLDRLAAASDAARDLAVDAYRRAVDQRPDHLTGHRLLAFALVRAGRLEEAFAALERGIAQPYPAGRFAGGERILREDLGLVAAAWTRAAPGRAAEIARRLRAAGGVTEDAPSIRFVLTWETDANDVDFHIRDARGGHAFYQQKTLASGGELYADVTTGYGPECFTIRGAPQAAPYQLGIHYYARGPMGYGMGKLEIVRHDGKGGLTFEQRPYVVMNDRADVDLGTVE